MELQMEMIRLRQKRNNSMASSLRPVAPIIKSWFLQTSLKFMKESKLTLANEDFLAEVSDYYLDALEKITKCVK